MTSNDTVSHEIAYVVLNAVELIIENKHVFTVNLHANKTCGQNDLGCHMNYNISCL